MLCHLFSGLFSRKLLCNTVKHEKKCQTPQIAIIKPSYRTMLLFLSSLTILLLTIDNSTYYCLQFGLFFSQSTASKKELSAKGLRIMTGENLSSGIAEMSNWQSGIKE